MQARHRLTRGGTLTHYEGEYVVSGVTLFIFLGDGRPRLVRIEPLHLLKLVEDFGSEVFVIDDTIMADDEGPHSGYAIFGRCSDQPEAPYHHAFHHEIDLAKRQCGPLSFQNLKEIAVVRLVWIEGDVDLDIL